MEQRTQVQSSTARSSVPRRLGPTTVGDVMTTQVKSVSPDASVEEAMALFDECMFRHLVVVDADGRLAGVICDRDVLRQAVKGSDPDGKAPLAIPIEGAKMRIEDLNGDQPRRQSYLIDANTGATLRTWNEIDSIVPQRSPVAASRVRIVAGSMSIFLPSVFSV